MTKLIACRGLSASGKSFWARELVARAAEYVRVNRDDIREMIHNDVWNQKREKTTVLVRNAIINAALVSGKNVICDDTNLAPSVMEELRNIAKDNKAEFEIKDFTHVTPQECIKRDIKRVKSVGASVIWKQYRDYLKPEAVPQDPALPKAILVDMDGTLAIIGDRGVYEDDKCEVDLRHEAVADMVEGYLKSNPHVNFIVMSGRDEGRAHHATMNWLNRHISVEPTALLMRKAGDTRHDNIVKRELFDAHIRGQYNVQFCVDDRDSVVHLWRDELGLPTCQVNWGDF